MAHLNPDSAEYVNQWASRLSGPPVSRAGSWSATAAWSGQAAIETRSLILLGDTHPELRALLSRGNVSLNWQPGKGSTGSAGVPGNLGTVLPGQQTVGIGFGIGVSIGQFVASEIIRAEDAIEALKGLPESKEDEDKLMFASVVKACAAALQVLPQRLATRTLRDKNRDGSRIKIHGFSRRRGH